MKKKKRDPEEEIPLAGLVPEREHSKEHTYAPEHCRQEKKQPFRHPLRSLLPRLALVDIHDEHCKQVHENEEGRNSLKYRIHGIEKLFNK